MRIMRIGRILMLELISIYSNSIITFLIYALVIIKILNKIIITQKHKK
jgi:hypothetical protein